MDYPLRKSAWKYVARFVAILFAFAAAAICDLFDIPSKIFPDLDGYVPRIEANVNLITLGLFLLGFIVAGWVVFRDAMRERDGYFNIVESCYGINKSLGQLKELRREANRLWDEAPRHWNAFDGRANMQAVQMWSSRHNDWRERVEHTLIDLFSAKDAARFKSIDESIEVGPEVASTQDMRILLGRFQQHMANLDQIIKAHDTQTSPVTSA